MWKFQENETAHGERIGETFNRTRQMRRALLDRLNGTEHKIYEWLRDLSTDFLMARLMVNADGDTQTLAPDGIRSGMRIGAEARRNRHTYHDVGKGQKRAARTQAGKTIGKVPHPYRPGSGSEITLSDSARIAIASAFEKRSRGASYAAAIAALEDAGISSATNGGWTPGAARAFFQNPIHAGYAVHFPTRDGKVDKRGKRVFLHPVRVAGGPVISIEQWQAANPVMQGKLLIIQEGDEAL